MARVTNEQIKALNGYAELKDKFEDIKPKTISAIAGGRKRPEQNYKNVIGTLLNKQGTISSLIACRLSIKNICAMMSKSDKYLTEGIKALVDLTKPSENNSPSTLDKLTDAGLSIDNISSMMCGAGKYLPEGIKALEDLIKPSPNGSRSTLKKLTDAGLSTDNISGMMNGAGRYLSEGIKALEDFTKSGENNSPSTLQKLTDAGLSIDSVSSIMHGIGKNLPKVQSMMEKYLEQDEHGASRIDYLILGGGLTATEISKYLRNSRLQFDKKLKALEAMPNSIESISLGGRKIIISGNPPKEDKTKKTMNDASAVANRIVDICTTPKKRSDTNLPDSSSKAESKMPAKKKQRTNPQGGVSQSARRRTGQDSSMNTSFASPVKTGNASAISPQNYTQQVIKRAENTVRNSSKSCASPNPERTSNSSGSSVTPQTDTPNPNNPRKKFAGTVKGIMLERMAKGDASQGKGSPGNFRG